MEGFENIHIPIPYPGLRSFNSDEQVIFFGRDAQIYFMTDRLAAERFLCITGPSGCGKSSLARTGLVSGLRAGQVTVADDWVVLDTHPGNDPFKSLVEEIASSLSGIFDDPKSAAYLPSNIELNHVIMQSLEQSRFNLSRTLSQYAKFKEQPVLLLVDQFEELFEYAKENREAATRFVRMLLDAVKPSDGIDLYVAITIRADALDNCSRYEGLAEAINRGQFLTPALNREELSEIIRGPIALHDGDVDSAFVGWLLNQMAHEPDRLPLLQHVMNLLWEDEKKRIDEGINETSAPFLDIADFKRTFPKAYGRAREIGDALRFALSDRLDQVFDELRDDLKPVAEKLFCALVEVFAGDKDIKRRLTVEKLAQVTNTSEENICTIVDHFRMPGRQYLHPGIGDVKELKFDTVVRVMHECLLRQWRMLRHSWLRDHERSITALQFLARLAMDHELKGGGRLSETQVASYCEWREKQAPTEEWAVPFLRTLEWPNNGKNISPEDVFRKSMVFLDECAQQIQSEKLAERLSRRKRRRRWMFLRTLATITSIILVATGAFLFTSNKAELGAAQDAELQAKVASEFVEQQLTVLSQNDGEANPVLCAELTDGAEARADGGNRIDDFDCVTELTADQIQSISTDLQREGETDSNKVQLAVSRAIIEQRDAALSQSSTQNAVETPEPSGNSAATPNSTGIETNRLIDHSLNQQILDCDDVNDALMSLDIGDWDQNQTVGACTYEENNPVLSDIPDDSVANRAFAQGREHLNRGRVQEALASFQEVYDIEPNIPRLYRYVGWAHAEKDNGKAWVCFREAVSNACRIPEAQARDEQLLWGWSNLTWVPDQIGNGIVAGAAWAQKGLLYETGQAYSAEELRKQPRHSFRTFEAFLNASKGFEMERICDHQTNNSRPCDASIEYLTAANNKLLDFVRAYPLRDSNWTQTGFLGTAGWEWASNELLRNFDDQGQIRDGLISHLERAVRDYGTRAPSLSITLSLLYCLRGDKDRADSYNSSWPKTTFADRKSLTMNCIQSLQ